LRKLLSSEKDKILREQNMARKLLKYTLSLVLAFYFAFLALFGLGDYLYPDSISRFQGDEVDGLLCFSFASQEASPSGQEPIIRQEGKILAFGFLPVKNVTVSYYPQNGVICGGELFGIRMKTKGLLVSSVGTVETENGPVSPGGLAGLKSGDVLLTCDGVELTSAADFAKLLSKSSSTHLLTVQRQGSLLEIGLTPAQASDGSGKKAGLWVRDGAAGIGTVTFRDPISGEFAGLGHAVCDAESKTPFPLESGTVCAARVEKVRKGEAGKAGEIRGALEQETVGELVANTSQGVFGRFFSPTKGKEETFLPIGLKDEVKEGDATILCTLDNSGKKEYRVRILKILDKERKTKNFILQITDPALLEQTGGIVQGMSGSPILQNGKLIGAVTHVLIDDPTQGYGILIENMLSGMQE
jgi:stage IV sporulation protein B